MSDDKNIRHRFTVPAADTIVNEWIENQSNLGFSLRTLIKAFVKTYGYKDATCFEFGTTVKKRGRPPKQVKIQYESMMDEAESYEDSNESEETVNVASPIVSNTVAPKDVPKSVINKLPPQPRSTTDDSDDDGFIDPESLFN